MWRPAASPPWRPAFLCPPGLGWHGGCNIPEQPGQSAGNHHPLLKEQPMCALDSLRHSLVIACVLTASLLGPDMPWAQESNLTYSGEGGGMAVSMHVIRAPSSRDLPAVPGADTYVIDARDTAEVAV